MSNTISKKRRVMDFLAKGNTLTPNQAKSRFGVANMRATMSDIKSTVEAYGNWEVTTSATPGGLTAYGIDFYGYDDNPHWVRANG